MTILLYDGTRSKRERYHPIHKLLNVGPNRHYYQNLIYRVVDAKRNLHANAFCDIAIRNYGFKFIAI